MIVFVTGGSGFVGGHLVEHLVAAGHTVRALARSSASAAVVAGFGAEPVRGELGGLTGALLRGADAVVHCAAFVEEWGTREQFWQGNVVGTENALAAARAGGVARLVHVGTEAAVFDGHDLDGIDETQPYPARHRYLYSETKAAAEQRVLAAADGELFALSVRPRLVWGPRDATILPAVLRMARAGSFAWLDQGSRLTSTTHVRNLTHALGLALTAGRSGQAYFVADDGERTMRSFLGALARTQGVDLGDKSVPSWVARPVARAVEASYRLLGAALRRDWKPPMTRFAVEMMSSQVTVRCDKARRELGYAPVVTVEAGLAELGSGA